MLVLLLLPVSELLLVLVLVLVPDPRSNLTSPFSFMGTNMLSARLGNNAEERKVLKSRAAWQ